MANYTKEQIQAVAMSMGIPQSAFDGKGGAENMLKSRGQWDEFQTKLQQQFTPYSGGTQSMFVAPFSQLQEEGIKSLGQPVTAGSDYYGQAGQYLTNASNLVNQAAQAPTSDDFNQWYGTFRNPYQQDVFDATMGAIDDAGARARSRISAAQARLGRTGDSATALQMAELDKNIAKQVAETGANLNSSGFNTAATMAQNQMQNNRSGMLQALSSALGLSTNATNLGNTLRGNALTDIQNKLTAGGMVQRQDQANLSAAQGEFGAQNNYSGEQLMQMMNLLQGIQGYATGSGGATPVNYNSGSRMADMFSVGGALASQYFPSVAGQQIYTSPIGPQQPVGSYGPQQIWM